MTNDKPQDNSLAIGLYSVLFFATIFLLIGGINYDVLVGKIFLAIGAAILLVGGLIVFLCSKNPPVEER